MCEAPSTWRARMWRMVPSARRAEYSGLIAAPGMPKAVSMPSLRNIATAASIALIRAMDHSSYVLLDSFYTWPKHAALELKAELVETSVLSISGVSNGSLHSRTQLRAGRRSRQLRRRCIEGRRDAGGDGPPSRCAGAPPGRQADAPLHPWPGADRPGRAVPGAGARVAQGFRRGRRQHRQGPHLGARPPGDLGTSRIRSPAYRPACAGLPGALPRSAAVVQLH